MEDKRESNQKTPRKPRSLQVWLIGLPNDKDRETSPLPFPSHDFESSGAAHHNILLPFDGHYDGGINKTQHSSGAPNKIHWVRPLSAQSEDEADPGRTCPSRS